MTSHYVPPHLRTSSPRLDARSSGASASSSRPRPQPRQNHAGGLASPAGDLRPSRRDFSSGPVDIEKQLSMLSISRSGGEGGAGDALRDPALQQVFKNHLDQRILLHYRTFPESRRRVPPATATDEIESLQSIVLMHRKLREGVSALQRIDPFAVEVYESSVRFAILATNHGQLQSALYHLVDGVYPAVRAQSAGAGAACPLPPADWESRPCSGPHDAERAEAFTTLRALYALVREPRTQARAHLAGLERASAELVALVARVLAPETFSPTAYWVLVHSHDALSLAPAPGAALADEWLYARAVLAMAADSVRERAWERLRAAYLQMSVEGVRLQLGLGEGEVREWAAAKKARVEGDTVKFR